MSIRRKSTAHDLATLRIHPDGSRVQQSSINRRPWKVRSTASDIRGNWIAQDAGGKADVSKTRTVRTQTNDEDGEIFDIHAYDDVDEDKLTTQTNEKGKQRASESDSEHSSGERTGKNFRARKRSSFTQDWSFLAPSPHHSIRPESEFHSENNSSSRSASETVKVTLPDPSPELLKCIHHFTSRYYQEKGVLSDRSRGYREERKSQRFRKGEPSIHHQTAKPTLWTADSLLGDGDGDEWEDENEDEDGTEDKDECESTSSKGHEKDMYKAFDGSVLVAIGIILQEQIAHVMTASFSSYHSR